jgi:hypothetical protein
MEVLLRCRQQSLLAVSRQEFRLRFLVRTVAVLRPQRPLLTREISGEMAGTNAGEKSDRRI